MKWETVKETVGAHLRTAIIESRADMASLVALVASGFEAKKGRTRHEMMTAYADTAWHVIMKWDVRCVGKLRDLFLGYFPPSLSKGQLVAYMADNENSDWMVEVKKP